MISDSGKTFDSRLHSFEDCLKHSELTLGYVTLLGVEILDARKPLELIELNVDDVL